MKDPLTNPSRGLSALYLRRTWPGIELLRCAVVRADSGPSLDVFRFSKNLDEIHYSNFQLKIRWTKYDLIIKLITRMDRKSRNESIKPN